METEKLREISRRIEQLAGEARRESIANEICELQLKLRILRKTIQNKTSETT